MNNFSQKLNNANIRFLKIESKTKHNGISYTVPYCSGEARNSQWGRGIWRRSGGRILWSKRWV